MSNMLERLGRWVAVHHRLVLVIWVVGLVTLIGSNRISGGDAIDDFQVPGVESQAAVDLLEERFPQRSGATAMVVFHVRDGADHREQLGASAIATTVDAVRALDHVRRRDRAHSRGPRSISPGRLYGVRRGAVRRARLPTWDVPRTRRAGRHRRARRSRLAFRTEFGGELPTVLKERSDGARRDDRGHCGAGHPVGDLPIARSSPRSCHWVSPSPGSLAGLSIVGLLERRGSPSPRSRRGSGP
jgi:RND superfamily putative drug exporter